GRREVWPRSGQTRMSGALLLWLLSCWASNKKVTRPGGPKPEVSAHSVSTLITKRKPKPNGSNTQTCQSGVNTL
ncbi:hypothetical protein, partial [Pseudomonas sp. BAY1663]|uniref:hypothetical protein n=1 Tax=Pseudomonas sp. BAY1663 TaxID=1439940 RepID=UPI001C46BA61